MYLDKVIKQQNMKNLLLLIFAIIVSLGLQSQESNVSFKLESISEKEYKKAFQNNYNAPFVQKINDVTKLEQAYNAIAKTYTNEEKELAENELTTPKKLTEFKGYYPDIKTYLFYIQDYHYEKACFVSSLTNQVISPYRFRGSFGVMSKDGIWVGLERNDCDNYLQIEICKITNEYAISIIKFDYLYLDISEEETPQMFWAKKNTIYISTIGYNKQEKPIKNYYSIAFEY